METVQVQLHREVFERLKLIAEPLVDDTNSVVERLLKHWESAPPGPRTRTIVLPEPGPVVWRSARGEKFPIDTKLRARYLGHTFEAMVTSNGIKFKDHTYDNPSSAGIAAKESVGTQGNAASTNGWDFWEMQDPESKQWVSINVLRSKNGG